MEEKVCKNCKYYLPHYIKKKASLLQIGGQCMYSNVKGKRGRKMEMHADCKKWESTEQKEAENRKVIQEVLRDMEKHLAEIALILKDLG